MNFLHMIFQKAGLSGEINKTVRGTGSKLREGRIKLMPGMTLAIEPMINLGRADVAWEDDEWTVVTMDGSLSAHYENTILITDGEPEILTLTK